MTTKKSCFAFVSIVVIVTLSVPSDSFSFARTMTGEAANREVSGQDGRSPGGATICLDGGRVYGRFHIRNMSVTNFQPRTGHAGYMPAASEISTADDKSPAGLTVRPTGPAKLEVTGERISGQRINKTAALATAVIQREIKNSKNAGGDVLRSLLTLPSVTVANDFSTQLNIRGAEPNWNAVLMDGVPAYLQYPATGKIPGFNSPVSETTGHHDQFTVENRYFEAMIEKSTRELTANFTRELFHFDVQINQIGRNDPRFKSVLPKDYYQNAIPVSNLSNAELSTMSVEESERKHTPYPFTDKGNHFCRDLMGYFNLKSIFKSDLLAAGTTYMLSTGFELIEPRIDNKVRGPNHYDPAYGAASYAFFILQEKGLIPRNFWWSIDFYTDDNPMHNSEHKPMRAELHYSLPLAVGKLDLVAFYDNHGHDPTISYPVNIRISSENGK